MDVRTNAGMSFGVMGMTLILSQDSVASSMALEQFVKKDTIRQPHMLSIQGLAVSMVRIRHFCHEVFSDQNCVLHDVFYFFLFL